MSKYDVLNLLKSNNKFFTERQIVNLTHKSQPSVNRHLNSLVKGKSIMMKQVKIAKLNKNVKVYKVRK